MKMIIFAFLCFLTACSFVSDYDAEFKNPTFNQLLKPLGKTVGYAYLTPTSVKLSKLHNKDKIDYSTYEHNGWFVGSGAIESSNKTVVQQRLKQAGMRWSVDGANYLIALRCMDESDSWGKIEKIVVDYLNK